MLLHKKGQSTLEYAIIIAVVAGALLAMNIFMKRGVEGKLRSSTNDIGEQFEAGNTTYNKHTESHGTTVQTVTGEKTVSENIGEGESTTRSGSENVSGW